MFIANEIITETERFINEFENGMNKVCIYLEKAGREFNVEMKANLLSVVCEAEGSTTVDQKESDLEEKDAAVKTKLAERIKNAIKVAIEFIIKFKDKVMNIINEKFKKPEKVAEMKKIKQILIENSAIGKTEVEVPVKLLSATKMMNRIVSIQNRLVNESYVMVTADIQNIEDDFNELKKNIEESPGTTKLNLNDLFDLYDKFVKNNTSFESLCKIDFLAKLENKSNITIEILSSINSLNKTLITEGSTLYINTITEMRSILISEVGKLAGKEEPIKESFDDDLFEEGVDGEDGKIQKLITIIKVLIEKISEIIKKALAKIGILKKKKVNSNDSTTSKVDNEFVITPKYNYNEILKQLKITFNNLEEGTFKIIDYEMFKNRMNRTMTMDTLEKTLTDYNNFIEQVESKILRGGPGSISPLSNNELKYFKSVLNEVHKYAIHLLSELDSNRNINESFDEEPADIDGVVDELLEPTDPDEIDPDVSKEIDDIIDDIVDDEDDDDEPVDDTDDDEEIPDYDSMTDDEFYESLNASL